MLPVDFFPRFSIFFILITLSDNIPKHVVCAPRPNKSTSIMFATRVPHSGCRRMLDLYLGNVFFPEVEGRWAYGNELVHGAKSVKTAVSSRACSSIAFGDDTSPGWIENETCQQLLRDVTRLLRGAYHSIRRWKSLFAHYCYIHIVGWPHQCEVASCGKRSGET